MARRVSIAALGTSAKTEGPVNVYTETVDSEPSQRKWMEGMPLGTRGGANFTYHFPADGEYTIQDYAAAPRWRNRRFPPIQNQLPTDEPPQRERIVLNLDGKPVGLFLIGTDQTFRETIPTSGQNLADLPEPPVKDLSRAEFAARRLNGR